MEDLYFKNHEARLIFGLVILSKKMQMDFLGIEVIKGFKDQFWYCGK